MLVISHLVKNPLSCISGIEQSSNLELAFEVQLELIVVMRNSNSPMDWEKNGLDWIQEG